jgi:tripeptide aminopeptidase
MARARSTASSPKSSVSVSSAVVGPEPDLRQALRLVLEMMPISGRSGDEQAIANYVVQQLTEAGLSADLMQFDDAHRHSRLPGNCGNLIVQLPGTYKAPRRLLTAHLDTVPICVGCEPKRKGGEVRSANPATGLGADNRAGAAVLLNTLLELQRRKLPHPPLTFCWFVQEEVGLNGARHVKKSLLGKPKLAFNWDGGSATKLTVGATGGYRMDMEVRGLASHAGGAPEKGVSAIAIAALAIADLQRGGWHGDVRQGNHRGTSNVGVIQGGEATNVVTDLVRLRAEARSHDPKFRQKIITAIERAFTSAAKEVRSVEGVAGSVSINGRLDYEAFRLDEREPCVLEAERVMRELGMEPIRAISNGGLDANWLTAHGIPSVTMGCGQVSPHTVAESLAIPQFEMACRIALRLATATS